MEICRIMYLDEMERIHSRRFADKKEANTAFQIISKHKELPVRCDILNEHGEVVKTKTYGPVVFWEQTLSERISFKKMYFEFGFDGNVEETYLMTNKEAEQFLRDCAGEPGFGTEWIWCPVAPEY